VIVESFPGIRTKQLHKGIEKRDLGSPETVVIHVGTNELRTTTNLDWVMGEVYALVAMAKVKHPNCRLVLSGALWRDVSWWHIGPLNDRYEWIAGALGITFFDPNSWIEDGVFARDGLHFNGRGKRHLGHLYARISGLDVEVSPASKK
jgi:hypothetical protein